MREALLRKLKLNIQFLHYFVTSRPHSSGPDLGRSFFKKEPEIGAGNSGTEVPYSEFLGSLNGAKTGFLPPTYKKKLIN